MQGKAMSYPLNKIGMLFKEQFAKMIAMKWCACILICAYFQDSLLRPSEIAVKQVFSLVEGIGFLALLLPPAIMFIWGASSFISLFYRFLKGLAFYSVALWLIGHHGDALYQWVLTNPNDVVIFATALAVVWMIVHFSGAYSSGGRTAAERHRPPSRAVCDLSPICRRRRLGYLGELLGE